MRGLSSWISAICLLFVCSQAQAGFSPWENTDLPAGFTISPGTYPTHWAVPKEQPESVSGGGIYPFGEVSTVSSRPSGMKGAQRLKSRKPIFGLIKFPTHVAKQIFSSSYSTDNVPARCTIMFAIDESKGTGKGYDTLYVDAGGSHDLMKASKSVGVPEKWNKDSLLFRSAASIPQSRVFPFSKSNNLGRLSVAINLMNKHFFMGSCIIEGGWVGEIKTSNGNVPFLLVDTMQGSRYDQASSFATPGSEEIRDMVAFDWQNSGKFDENDNSAMFCLNGTSNIAGKLYSLQSDADGSKLVVEDYTGPTSRITVDYVKMGSVESIENKVPILGKSSFYLLKVNDAEITVPEGDYRIGMAQLYSMGESSSQCIEYYQKQTAAAKSGETLHLKIGGDSSLVIEPKGPAMLFRAGKQFGASFEVKTSTGGYVSSFSDSSQPTLTMRDAAGKSVFSKTFEYAPGWTSISGTLPGSIKPGEYTAEIKIDMGRFGGMVKGTKTVYVR